MPADAGPAAVTIGTFDGVHRGHRTLIDRVVGMSEEGLLPVAVTFDPHPMAVIRPDLVPPMLTTAERRLDLLAEAGLAGVLVLDFTPELAAESAERFATRVLAGTLAARRVVVGQNFRFGHRASGDVRLLAELGRELGFEVEVAELAGLATPQMSDQQSGPRIGSQTDSGRQADSGRRAGPGSVTPSTLPHGADQVVNPPGVVSSTAIRSMIAEGDVAGAGAALGRPHRLTGVVAHGDHRGRELGFPTANLDLLAGLACPADGVYAGWMRTTDGSWWKAAISVGTNPTFDGEDRRVEAFAVDVGDELDLYGHTVDVDLVSRIRPMLRFDSVAALVDQMTDDVERTRGLLTS